MNETTTTNPGTESSEGSGRRRNPVEIQDALTTMLSADHAEPQEEEQQSSAELELEDGLEEEVIDESYEDSEEVGEVGEEGEEEHSEGEHSSYRVTVDGKEMDVPLDELISGYQRESSFTQKSQALAEDRKGFHGEQEAVRQERESYAQVLAQLQQQMESASQPNIDWETLERENPVEWVKQRQLATDRQAQVQAVTEEQKRMQAMLGQQNQERLQEKLAVERQMTLEKIPEWAAKSKIKNVKSGGKQISQQMRGRKQRDQRARLKQTGKVQDAASLFATLLTE